MSHRDSRFCILAAAKRLVAAFAVTASSLSMSAQAADQLLPRSTGMLTFSPEGVLFIGDNVSSAVFAYPAGEAVVG